MTTERLTLKNAKAIACSLGWQLRMRWGEYQCKPRGTLWGASTTYFTDDIRDAIGTIRAEAARANPLPADGLHEYMCIAGNSWGRGPTLEEALKKLRAGNASGERKILIVPAGAWIDEIGRNVLWPTGTGKHAPGKCAGCRFD